MLIKVTGKNEMLEKLNTAKQLIDEAEKLIDRMRCATYE